MIRNYRAVMTDRLTSLQAGVVCEEIPGAWFDPKRQRLIVPGDALALARSWFLNHRLTDRAEIEENPYRKNPIPKDQWRVPIESISDLKPEWVEKLDPKQVEALYFFQDRQAALVQLPTGRGKTAVGIAAACAYRKVAKTIVVTVVPEQWCGAFKTVTTGDVKVAQVIGKVGFRAVRVVDRAPWKWNLKVSLERLASELAAMPDRRRETMLAALRAGREDGSKAVPKSLSAFIERVKVETKPYWKILRRSDGAMVQRIDLGSIPSLSAAELEVLQADAVNTQKPKTALVARCVLAAVRGWGFDPIADKVGLDAESVNEIVSAYAADHYCRLRSENDLGVPPGTDIVVVSWALLVERLKALQAWSKAPTIILDESHMAKARKRTKTVIQPDGKKRYDPLYNLSWAASELCWRAPRVLELSATPDVNTIQDLWAQYDLLNPRSWGSFSVCGKRYFGGIMGQHGMVYEKATNVEEFRERSKRIHFVATKAEMKAASPFERRIFYLNMEDLTAVTLSEAEWKNAAKRGQRATLEMQLYRLAEAMHRWVLNRIKAAIEAKQRIVILTGRKEHVHKIVEDVRKFAHATTPVIGITGEVSTADRRKHVAVFRVSGPGVMVATGDSMGTGVDGLQGTHVCVNLMLPWEPGEVDQREGRFDRFDDEHITTMIEYPIIQGTVGERILDVVVGKGENAVALLGHQDTTKLVKDLSMKVEGAARDSLLEELANDLLRAHRAMIEQREALSTHLVVDGPDRGERDLPGRESTEVLPAEPVSPEDLDLTDLIDIEGDEVYIDPWRDDDA